MVTPELKKGSPRADWFKAVKLYDGKDVDTYIGATSKKPPTFNKHGEGEPP